MVDERACWYFCACAMSAECVSCGTSVDGSIAACCCSELCAMLIVLLMSTALVSAEDTAALLGLPGLPVKAELPGRGLPGLALNGDVALGLPPPGLKAEAGLTGLRKVGLV